MKLNNRFIFGILSLLLAAVIAFVALPTIARQTNGKEEIVRITQPVLKGEQISSENAEVVEVGGYNLPSNIAHQLSDVNGLYATADLAVGDYILTNKISSVPVSSDVALNSIPSGKVAISLTVKTLASGLSDKLQPGDIIRIYHFLDTAAEVPELRFVKVLSVTDSDGINVDNAKEPTEDEEKQQSATITVLASPEQAKIITSDALICSCGSGNAPISTDAPYFHPSIWHRDSFVDAILLSAVVMDACAFKRVSLASSTSVWVALPDESFKFAVS